jgi:hypothetical protein
MSMFAIENGDLVGGFTQLDCMLDHFQFVMSTFTRGKKKLMK